MKRPETTRRRARARDPARLIHPPVLLPAALLAAKAVLAVAVLTSLKQSIKHLLRAQAASIYILSKAFLQAAPLMSKISSPKLHLQFAKAMEVGPSAL